MEEIIHHEKEGGARRKVVIKYTKVKELKVPRKDAENFCQHLLGRLPPACNDQILSIFPTPMEFELRRKVVIKYTEVKELKVMSRKDAENSVCQHLLGMLPLPPACIDHIVRSMFPTPIMEAADGTTTTSGVPSVESGEFLHNY